MSSRLLRGVLAGLVLVVGVFATVAEGEEEQSSSQAPEAPASTQQKPLPLGTTVEVAKGWDLTVISAELNANALAAQANMFNQPLAGNQFVAVNLSLTNTGDQPEAPFTSVKLSLLPPTGVAVDSAFVAGIPNEIEPTAQVQPGATATGLVLFQVPADAVPGSVLLGQSLFTLDAKADQKFLAIQ